MKLLLLAIALGAALTVAEPWNPRPGRGAYRRDAAPEPTAAPEPWNPRPGRGAYKRSPEPAAEGWDHTPKVLKNKREPVAEPEAEPYHYRWGEDVYTYSWAPWEKRDAMPTAAPVPVEY